MNKDTKLFINGTIAEMSATAEGTIEVPISGVDVSKLIEGDSDPMFVTVEALNNQVSRNGRNWTKEAIAEIAKQVNENKPDAFMGHLKDEDRGHKAPESKTLWLGAVVKEIQGKNRLFIKGYVLPTAQNLKVYLRKTSAIGKDVGVSVYGVAEQVYNKNLKAYDIKNFQLESIDWARSGAKGAVDTKYLQITSEMEDQMDKEQVIKEMTSAELKEHNSKLFDEVKNLGAEDAKTSAETSVQEMEKKITDKDALIASLSADREANVKSHIVSELEKTVKNPAMKEFMSKLVVAEMAGKEIVNVSLEDAKKVASEAVSSVLSSDNGKALVKEMIEKEEFSKENKDEGDKGNLSKFIKK